MQSDIRVLEAEPTFTDEVFRVPLKFGTGVITSITSLTVRVRVETRSGDVADGYGNILLSDLWAFPSQAIDHDVRDVAMRQVAQDFCRYLTARTDFDHPIGVYMDAKPALDDIRKQVGANLELPEEIPVLAGLVCSSPADAALHDAFGNANGICTYAGYGPEFMGTDLARWCGPEFSGEYPTDYLHSAYAGSLPIFHLVGGMDKLRESELSEEDPDDGLPVSLDQWIKRDGLRCFKVKLRGTDIDWDVQRTCEVAQLICEVDAETGCTAPFHLSTDSNEMNESPATVLEYLTKLREASKLAFDSLLYLEQPTERDLSCHGFDMTEVAQIKPVVVDEGVTDLSRLDEAIQLGWSGVGLKTCKGHSSSLLYVAKARKAGMALTVQDLTNPGRSLLHSIGLAARIETLMGVEYNSRQYLPFAEPDFRKRHEGLFSVRDGCVSTTSISVRGLGY